MREHVLEPQLLVSYIYLLRVVFLSHFYQELEFLILFEEVSKFISRIQFLFLKVHGINIFQVSR